VLPSVFTLVIGGRAARSPSIYPDDPESAHYDPAVFANQGQSGHHDTPAGEVSDHDEGTSGGEPAKHAGGQTGHHAESIEELTLRHEKEKLGFPWEPFLPERSNPYTTHHNVDELRGALGFTSEESPDADREGGAPDDRGEIGPDPDGSSKTPDPREDV
jgi:hypothetical protein